MVTAYLIAVRRTLDEDERKDHVETGSDSRETGAEIALARCA